MLPLERCSLMQYYKTVRIHPKGFDYVNLPIGETYQKQKQKLIQKPKEKAHNLHIPTVASRYSNVLTQ